MLRQAMDTFLSIHQDCVFCTLTTFDRMIFKGHFTMLYPNGAFTRLLNRQGVLLKDFKPYVEGVSQQIKRHAEELATRAGRPFRYLEASMTAKNGQSKEALAQQVAAEDHLKEGLVCVFYTLEPCSTFTVRGNRQTQKLEVIRCRSKCLHTITSTTWMLSWGSSTSAYRAGSHFRSRCTSMVGNACHAILTNRGSPTNDTTTPSPRLTIWPQPRRSARNLLISIGRPYSMRWPHGSTQS